MKRRNFIQGFFAAVGAGLLLRTESYTQHPLGIKDNSNPPFDPKQLLWGTYGKGRAHSMRIVMIGDCDTDHLQNILRTEDWHLNQLYRDGICQILKERGQTPIPVSQRFACCGNMDVEAAQNMIKNFRTALNG